MRGSQSLNQSTLGENVVWGGVGDGHGNKQKFKRRTLGRAEEVPFLPQ